MQEICLLHFLIIRKEFAFIKIQHYITTLINRQIMRFVVQLIDNYLHQKIPSILLSVEQQKGVNKYIFNVPPSHQRFLNNHKMKFQKGANYFFTKVSTQSIAGLTGMLLTMFQSKCAADSKLFVSQLMFEYLESIRYQMGFKFMPYSYISWKGQIRKGINNIQRVMQIRNSPKYSQIVSDFASYIDKKLDKKQVNDPQNYYSPQKHCFNDQSLTIVPFIINSNNEQITNFICTPKTICGKVNVEKMKQLKLEGRHMGELMKNGKIELKDGRIITKDQIIQPPIISPGAIILHFNTIQSVKAVMNNQTFKAYLQNKQNITQLLVHIVQDKQIIKSEDFQILLDMFPKDVQHLIYNRNFKNASDKFEQIIDKSYHIDFVSKLSQIYPQAMPNINLNNELYIKNHEQACLNIEDVLPNRKVHMYKQCFEFVVSPKKSVEYRDIPHSSKTFKELLQLPTNQYMIPESCQPKFDFSKINPKVIFLGTGSMKPSTHRNVSSIFIQYTNNASIMLDCGQGSYYQMFNHYGAQKIDQVLKTLRIVFITHIHSDHNLGVLDLIKQRIKLMKKYGIKQKLFLIIPYNVIPWFHNYVLKIQNLYQGCQLIFIQWLRNEPLINEKQLGATICKDQKLFQKSKSQMISEDQEIKLSQNSKYQKKQSEQSSQFQQDDMRLFIEYRSKHQKQLESYFNSIKQQTMKKFEQYLHSLEIVDFNPVPVIHCPQSFGIVIQHKSKIKISYSGDTRPVKQFAKASLNSTLMIHEATLGDDLQKDAMTNMHSTVGQAIDIGIQSKSWKLALTHFSQRYKSGKKITSPLLYKMDEQKYDYTLNNTIVCFDHLQVKLSQAYRMPFISRNIAQMIPDDKTDE